MASATVAYAMDIGGIQRTIQLWFHGDCTDVTIQFDGEGSYELEYTDAEGNEQSWAGGGVAIEDGVCYVKLIKDEETMYVTVKYKGGYSAGPHKFEDPNSWIAN